MTQFRRYTKFVIVPLSTLIFYRQELWYVFNESVNSELASYILMVPFLVGFLLYNKRKIISELAGFVGENLFDDKIALIEVAAGMVLCILGYVLKIYGGLTFSSIELHIVSMPLFAAGLVLILFGHRMIRVLIFPLFMLLFLVPPPFQLAQMAGTTLATVSAHVSFSLLSILQLPVTFRTEYGAPIIYLTTASGGSIPFAIDIACSGLYSLIGFIIFSFFTASISKGTLRAKLGAFILGLIIIYGLNIFRVSTLVVIGFFMGENMALNFFHYFGGWVLIFVGTFLLLRLSEKFLGLRFMAQGSNMSQGVINQVVINGQDINEPGTRFSQADAWKIIGILLAVMVLQTVNIPIFTLTSLAAEIDFTTDIEASAPTLILPKIEGYTPRLVYRDTDFERVSQQDASLMYQYVSQAPELDTVWVGVEIASAKASCHPWEACLITYAGENAVTQIDLKDIRLQDDPPLTARYFAFKEQDGGPIQVILYWYTRSIFKTEQGFEEKYVKISVIDYAYELNEVQQVEDHLLPFATAISQYWAPIAQWSSFAQYVARNWVNITTMLVISLVVLTMISYFFFIKKRRIADEIYTKLQNEEDRTLLRVISVTPPAQQDNLLALYKQSLGSPVETDSFIAKLKKAHEIGLVDKDMKMDRDQMHVYWKTNTSRL